MTDHTKLIEQLRIDFANTDDPSFVNAIVAIEALQAELTDARGSPTIRVKPLEWGRTKGTYILN